MLDLSTRKRLVICVRKNHGCCYLSYASAAENLQCRRHSVFGWVSLCILKTLWTPYLKNQWGEFYPILVTDVFGFIDVLIRIFGIKRSKIKVTTGNDLKTLWTPYLKNQWREFHSVLAADVFEFINMLIGFLGQRSRSQQMMTQKTVWMQYLRNCWR